MDRADFLLYPNAEATFLPLSAEASPGRQFSGRAEDLELDFLLHRTVQMTYDAFFVEKTVICLGNLCWLVLLMRKVRDHWMARTPTAWNEDTPGMLVIKWVFEFSQQFAGSTDVLGDVKRLTQMPTVIVGQ